MKKWNLLYILVLLLIAPAIAAGAVFEGELILSSGASGNILADSLELADQWTGIGGGLRLQLNSNFGARWSGHWSKYMDLVALNGDSQEFGLEFLKGKWQDRLHHYAGLSWSRMEYPDESYRISGRILALEAMSRYYLQPESSLRFGMEGSMRRFPSFDLADQDRFAAFAGLNHSFKGGSALDLEAGWDRVRYVNLTGEPEEWSHNGQGQSEAIDGSRPVLQVISLQARYSISMGTNTGIALSAWSYGVVSGEDEVLALPDLETLPQELFFFGERAAELSIKRYLPWKVTSRVRFGVWERQFLDTSTVDESGEILDGRLDEGLSFSMEVWRNFGSGAGLEWLPKFRLSWQEIESSDSFFNSDIWSGSLSLDLRFK